MLPKVLFVDDIPELQELCNQLRDSFVFVTRDKEEIRDRQGEETKYVAFIRRFDAIMQNDSDYGDLDSISGKCPSAILYSSEEQLSLATDFANKKSYFRNITNITSCETLKLILLEACGRSQLFQSHDNLDNDTNHSSLVDPLTGCMTRSYGLEMLTKNLKRAKRYAQYLGVTLCRIDGITSIRRTQGDTAADIALQAFGDFITNHLRADIDSVARWQEDTFLIILPETGIRGTGRASERIRDKFTKLSIGTAEKPLKTTLSLGATCYAPEYPEHNVSPEELLLLAERCLTQAQSAGGDMVLCCP